MKNIVILRSVSLRTINLCRSKIFFCGLVTLPCSDKINARLRICTTPREHRWITSNLICKFVGLVSFFWKKIRAPQKNSTVVIVAVSKKISNKKNAFPSGRNFSDRKSKKRPQITDRTPPDPKIIFGKLSVKTQKVARTFGRGLPPHNFRPFFQIKLTEVKGRPSVSLTLPQRSTCTQKSFYMP